MTGQRKPVVMTSSPGRADRRRRQALWAVVGLLALAVLVWAIWPRGGQDDSSGAGSPASTHPRPSQPVSDPTSSVTGGGTTASRTRIGRGPSSRGNTPSDQVPDDGLEVIAVVDLPVEAQRILLQLGQGGPFAYTKDGSTYFNRNGALPARERGYYREFTVLTPGARDRGARRLVSGGCGQQVSRQPVRVRPCTANNPVYWTDDHYDTFRRVGR